MRVGKIHLGVREKAQSGVEYPRAVDYFVVHEEATTPAASVEAFREVYGERPNELDILFPVDDPQLFADANYKMYTRSWGLGCRGDGEEALAKWDMAQDGPRPAGIEDGTWANRHTQSWTYRTIACAGPECPMQAGDKPQCRAVMNLQFLLPNVRGIGVWQIDSGSFNSIRGVLDSIELVKSITGGRIRGILLKLRLVPKEVTPANEAGGVVAEGSTGSVKTKTVHILSLSLPNVTLDQILAEAARLPADALLPPPVDDEETPDDLFPTALTAPEGAEEEAEARSVEESQPSPSSIGDELAAEEPGADLTPAAAGMQVQTYAKTLGVKSWRELCQWLGLGEAEAGVPGSRGDDGGPIELFNKRWLGIAAEQGLTVSEAVKVAKIALDAVHADRTSGLPLEQAVAAVSPTKRLEDAGQTKGLPKV